MSDAVASGYESDEDKKGKHAAQKLHEEQHYESDWSDEISEIPKISILPQVRIPSTSFSDSESGEGDGHVFRFKRVYEFKFSPIGRQIYSSLLRL